MVIVVTVVVVPAVVVVVVAVVVVVVVGDATEDHMEHLLEITLDHKKYRNVAETIYALLRSHSNTWKHGCFSNLNWQRVPCVGLVML